MTKMIHENRTVFYNNPTPAQPSFFFQLLCCCLQYKQYEKWKSFNLCLHLKSFLATSRRSNQITEITSDICCVETVLTPSETLTGSCELKNILRKTKLDQIKQIKKNKYTPDKGHKEDCCEGRGKGLRINICLRYKGLGF